MLLGETAGAHVRDAGTLPYLVATEDNLVSRVLTQVWDRDDVLSRIWHPLPVTVRQRVTATWSIERTAGLVPRVNDGIMTFAGSGRTVRIDTFDTPAGMTAEAAVAEMTKGAPQRREGELYEHDGESVRHALWLSAVVDGKPQHELYGYCATPAGIACVICMYDDVADLAWAQAVWRSARHTTTGR